MISFLVYNRRASNRRNLAITSISICLTVSALFFLISSTSKWTTGDGDAERKGSNSVLLNSTSGFVGETKSKSVDKSDRNFYSKVVYKEIQVRRRLDAPNIALVVIVYDNKTPTEYSLALKTLECYSALHDYKFINLNLEQEPEFLKGCPGKDFMFRRHCALVNLMKKEDEIEWFLFLDADMGVINPNHLIEEYIDPKVDLTFYDRLYNYEITAGAYLAKNSNFTHKFLKRWSRFEHNMKEGSFQAQATDNGAIHEVFLDQFCGDCAKAERERCGYIWGNLRNFDDLFLYESCARNILGARNKFTNKKGTVRQLSNPTEYWSRDGWHLDSRWSENDFIFHGWKEYKLHMQPDPSSAFPLANTFLSPFVDGSEFDMGKCQDPKRASLNWAYKDTFIRPKKEVERKLRKIHLDSFLKHLERIKKALQLNLSKMAQTQRDNLA